jgi:hypothetical protein
MATRTVSHVHYAISATPIREWTELSAYQRRDKVVNPRRWIKLRSGRTYEERRRSSGNRLLIYPVESDAAVSLGFGASNKDRSRRRLTRRNQGLNGVCSIRHSFGPIDTACGTLALIVRREKPLTRESQIHSRLSRAMAATDQSAKEANPR